MDIARRLKDVHRFPERARERSDQDERYDPKGAAAALLPLLSLRPWVSVETTFTISETAVLALAAGVRTHTVAVPGLAVGDICHLRPQSALPNDMALLPAHCLSEGVLTVKVMIPALSLGQSYSIPCDFLAMRRG